MSETKRLKKLLDDMRWERRSIMLFVDKWLEGEDLELDPANRAARARTIARDELTAQDQLLWKCYQILTTGTGPQRRELKKKIGKMNRWEVD